MFQRSKSIILIISIIVSAIIVTIFSAWAADGSLSESRRERCVKILYQGLDHDGYFWTSVHAAEALLWNGYFDGVKEKFAAMEDNAGARHRIGVWRVLARANIKNPVEYHKYLNLISAAFVNSQSPDRLHAIETLGKLGFSKQLPEIVHASNKEKEEVKVYARWVLANDGDPENEDALSELLSSENSKLYGTAGYALRFFDNVQPRTFSLLEQCAARLPFNAENRIYVSSAMYVHASPEKKRTGKKGTAKICRRK